MVKNVLRLRRAVLAMLPRYFIGFFPGGGIFGPAQVVRQAPRFGRGTKSIAFFNVFNLIATVVIFVGS